MTQTRVKPRIEVVDQLAQEALAAMEDSGIVELTAVEVLSASFTMCARITKIVLNGCEPADKDINIDIITEAIGKLYELVPSRTVH